MTVITRSRHRTFSSDNDIPNKPVGPGATMTLVILALCWAYNRGLWPEESRISSNDLLPVSASPNKTEFPSPPGWYVECNACVENDVGEMECPCVFRVNRSAFPMFESISGTPKSGGCVVETVVPRMVCDVSSIESS